MASKFQEVFREKHSQLSDVTGNLVSAARGNDIDTVYVTSAHPGEGKTTMAMAMAYGLETTATRRVALVEANMSSPSFGTVFDISSESPGLYDFLLGEADLDEVSHHLEEGDPVIVSGGTRQARNVWLDTYEEERYTERLSELTDEFMYSVFDGDSVITDTGSTIAVREFEATVLTVECGATKWQVASLARDKLVGYGANILGVALNKRKYPIPTAIYSRV